MRQKIPKALREMVWLSNCGDKFFKQKCFISWCQNVITPFRFEVGHDIPVSKGGSSDLTNLKPICSNCNRSMGDEYTIKEFSRISLPSPRLFENFRYSKPDAQDCAM